VSGNVKLPQSMKFLRSIKLTREEGPTHLTNRPHIVTNFLAASRSLWEWSSSAPEIGYHKVSVEVAFTDDKVFKIRYDLVLGAANNPALDDFCRRSLSFSSGRKIPERLTRDQWKVVLDRNPSVRDNALLWLAFYHFSDAPRYKVDLFNPGIGDGVPNAILVRKGDGFAASENIHDFAAVFETFQSAENAINSAPEIHRYDCNVVANN
jgi:hypothetical protein